jgi:tetratricopeptide (TPR) repeat protein
MPAPELGLDSLAVAIPPELHGAVASMEAGDYAAAAAELNGVVRRDTADVRAWRLLASAYTHLDAYVQAIQVCRTIALLDTVDAGVPVALGYLHQQQGDLDAAEPYYHRALEMDPDMIQAYQGLGWIYLERREHEKALEMGTRSTERAPDYAPNYILIGRVLTAQGFYEDAAAAYRRAFSLRPDLRERYGILLQELVIRHRLIR